MQYLHHFGEQAYFVNIPSKFISADGRTLWLCYAANFAPNWNGMKIKANPPGSRYGMCLQEVKTSRTEQFPGRQRRPRAKHAIAIKRIQKSTHKFKEPIIK